MGRRWLAAIVLMLLASSAWSEDSKVATKKRGLDPLKTLENSLVFQPSKFPAGDWQPRGWNFEDAWFQSADGTHLHGWYVGFRQPRAVILYCHGNAGNVATWGDVLPVLQRRLGASVLLFDYRGYGRSGGTPDEAGVLADARAARAWLAKRAGVAEKDIILMGRSLGGAVAVDLASRDGARALVLESTFSSIPDVAASLSPLAPTALMRTRFDSASKIAAYRGPLLQSHGDADTLVPFRVGRKLFESAKTPDKKFLTLRGRNHNDPQPVEYYHELAAFVGRLPRTERGE